MKEYNGPLGFSIKAMVIRTAFSVCLAFGVLAYMHYSRPETFEGLSGWFVVIPLGLIAAALGTGFYIGYRKAKALVLHVSLTDYVIRGQVDGHYDISIHRDDIESMRLADNGDIIIKSKNALQGLRVSHSMEGYADISAHVAHWQPIGQHATTGPRHKDWKAALPTNIAALLQGGGFVVTMFSKDYITVAVAGAITLVAGVVCFVLYRKLEDSLTALKKYKWLVAALTAAATLKWLMVITNALSLS